MANKYGDCIKKEKMMAAFIKRRRVNEKQKWKNENEIGRITTKGRRNRRNKKRKK